MASRELETRLIEAQVSIAESLKGIKENVKVLNDHNILHSTKTEEQHKTIIDKLKVLTEKYWWLLVILIGIIVAMAGYTKIASVLLI